jgi:hypothetical protein
MRFYRYNEDWISHLEGGCRSSLIATIRSLGLERLQKYPPPKLTGLPFGNETRIVSRFLGGRSSQLDASALSSLYRSFMPAGDRQLYRAFRQNEYLPPEEWRLLIGSPNVDLWIENKFLTADAQGNLQCQFSVVAVDGLLFASDPLKDHGRTWEPGHVFDTKDPRSEDVHPFHHTYMGLDSLRMIEVMEADLLPGGGRYLDCGPGSGSLLLYFSRRFQEAVGIDLNARAAKLSRFNADLNELSNVTTYNDNAIELAGKYGRFDLLSWNLPFIFMPNEDEKTYIDGFGGELGIGLCLKFIETLPSIMTQSGIACVAALAPITEKGDNVLEARLRDLIPKVGLDCTVQVAQISVAHNRELWDFHRSYGLTKFESVYLWLKPGTGKLTRKETPWFRKAVDTVRERLYSRKFA